MTEVMLSESSSEQSSASKQTQELQSDCKDFIKKISELQGFVDGFVTKLNGYGDNVQSLKEESLKERNMLKSLSLDNKKKCEKLLTDNDIVEAEVQLEKFKQEYELLFGDETLTT